MKPRAVDSLAVVEAAEKRLRDRLDALGIKVLSKRGGIEEAAFLAGAATVLHEVYGGVDGNLSAAVPPLWIIAPMTGRSVLVERDVAKAKLAKGTP